MDIIEKIYVKSTPYFRVRWLGYPNEGAFEPLEYINECFAYEAFLINPQPTPTPIFQQKWKNWPYANTNNTIIKTASFFASI